MLRPVVYATDERVAYGARTLGGATVGPAPRAKLAREAGAPYYSRPFVHKVNDTIPHRYVFASVEDKLAPGPGVMEIGDLLFAYERSAVDDEGPPDAHRNGLNLASYTQRCDPYTCYAMSWQHLEAWLEARSDRYRTGHEIAREWRLLGAAHNDVLPGGFRKAAPKDAPTRALNVVVGGRAAVSNYWGEAVKPGAKLYFKVERDDATRRWHLTPVASYKRPAVRPHECLIPVGKAVESASSDPFYNNVAKTDQRAAYVRKCALSHRVVIYLGI